MSQHAPTGSHPDPVVTVAGPRPAPNRSVVVTVSVIVCVLVLGGLGTLGWLWRHPTAFPPAGNEVHDSAARPGLTTFVGIADLYSDKNRTVRIDAASPVVVDGGAPLTTSVLICTVGPAGGVGLARGAGIDQACTSLEPAIGATISLGSESRQQLVLAITPTEFGEAVDISGVDLSYADGWQHGTQRIGPRVTLTVSNG
ncbi:hypothetical protein [Nocardioides sp. URHA0020]|uniref:hypothetical protein n=1 Tax=Nocardioides sp. URHA0020 TaxID=1380392 RepID=UPI0012DC68AD|nr:hypothetical protein [Nocardioides sp. URHA0020]